MAISVQTKTAQPLSLAQRATSHFWLGYFLFTIGALGIFFAYATAIPFYILSHIWSPLRGLADACLMYGTRVLMFVQPWFNAKIEYDKLKPLLKEPSKLLFVSNHRSHLDVFLLLLFVPGVRVLAKKPLFSVPFLSPLMYCSRQIPVAQGRIDLFLEAMERVRERILLREHVHVFPELTRCPAGFEGTQNFSSAPFKIAKETEALIVPIAIKGSDDVWPKGFMGLNFRRPIKVTVLEPVNTKNFDTIESLKAEVQKRIENSLK